MCFVICYALITNHTIFDARFRFLFGVVRPRRLKRHERMGNHRWFCYMTRYIWQNSIGKTMLLRGYNSDKMLGLYYIFTPLLATQWITSSGINAWQDITCATQSCTPYLSTHVHKHQRPAWKHGHSAFARVISISITTVVCVKGYLKLILRNVRCISLLLKLTMSQYIFK